MIIIEIIEALYRRIEGMMSIEQEIMNNPPQCGYLIPFYEDYLENLNLLMVTKDSYGLALTSYGEKFLKACLNEKSKELIDAILNVDLKK